MQTVTLHTRMAKASQYRGAQDLGCRLKETVSHFSLRPIFTWFPVTSNAILSFLANKKILNTRWKSSCLKPAFSRRLRTPKLQNKTPTGSHLFATPQRYENPRLLPSLISDSKTILVPGWHCLVYVQFRRRWRLIVQHRTSGWKCQCSRSPAGPTRNTSFVELLCVVRIIKR